MPRWREIRDWPMNIVDQIQDTTPLWFQIALLPPLYVAFGGLGFLAVVVLKWLLVGRYKNGNHPLWCHFVWRTELVTGLYENFGVLFFLDILRGTPFIAWPLRLMGMRIGRRCYIDSSWFTEFDCISVDDEAQLNEDANLQTHLFEDRVMKVAGVHEDRPGRRAHRDRGNRPPRHSWSRPGSTMSTIRRGAFSYFRRPPL